MISVIFPAYNEELSVENTVNRAVSSLQKVCADFEILIIDDCSTDSTGAICDRLAAADERIRVIHNQKNLTQGGCLRLGFAQAKKDLVMHNAIDYPFDLEDLPKLLALIGENDIVVATRNERAGYSLYRKAISHINLFLLRTLFPLKLNDYSFVQLYKKSVVQSVQIVGRSTGFVIPELLIRSHMAGFKIAQVEITYLPRTAGIARSGHPKILVASLYDLIRFWIECRE